VRPIRLVLTSFGPFPGSVTVDFERLGRHGMFLIHGPTGAGKSTLLDAMTFALFGDTKGGPERGGASFVSSLAPLERTSVDLVFAVGDTRYRVVRHPTQQVARTRGDGSAGVTRQAEARLERLDAAGGVAETLAEKSTEASHAVQALLGLGVEQFRQTVVLPQGQFREVVTDEKAREAVLKRLFDTQRFADLTTHLKSIASELNQAGEAQRRTRDQVLEQAGVTHRDGLREALAEAATTLREASDRRAEREAERDAAHAKRLEAKATLARFEQLEGYVERVRQIEADEEAIRGHRERLRAARRAQRLEVAFERRARALAARDEARGATATTREEEAAARARHEAAQATLAEARGEDRERTEARDLVQRLKALEPDVRGLGAQRSDHAALRDRIAAARSDLDGARERRQSLDAERTALRVERSALRADADALEAARERHEACQRRSEALAALDSLEATIDDATRHLGRIETGDSDGDGADALLHLLRSHAAGLVSAGLDEGEPCPVCGSTHHPAPHPGTEPAALEAALQRFQTLQQERAGLVAALTLHRSQRDAALTAQGWTDERPDSAALERDLRDAADAHTTAQAASQRIGEIERRLEALGHDVESADAHMTSLTLALGHDEAEADARQRDIDRTVAKLPGDATDTERFLARLEAAAAHADALEHALSEAREREASAARDLAALASRLEERATRQAASEHDARQAEEAFVAGLDTNGFADEAAFLAARLDEHAITDLEGRIDAHDEARAAATAQRDELRTALADVERPDLALIEAALEAALAAWRHADEALSAAQQAHDRLARHAEAFDAAAAAYQALEAKLSAATRLARLAGGTVPGRPKVDLETFVLQRQFHDVLQVGNQHLREMTAGRYTLHLVRDTTSASASGLDLEVADHFVNSVRRAAKTLSGGEGFLAALALALGLSDIAQRSRHPIEALFIDEGFGSLDRTTLDQVTHTLRTLPHTAGRLIGIISHVEDLKRLIPVQLVVSAGEGGSRLEVRVNE
jgi:DNA repair protein SbcC/Rad50